MNSNVKNDYIKDWLTNEDRISFDERLTRLRWLVDEFGEFGNIITHYGGFISFRAFEEVRRCYLYGEFIAVVLLSQIVLEHTLAGLFLWLTKGYEARAHRMGLDIIWFKYVFDPIADDPRFKELLRKMNLEPLWETL